MKRLETLLFLAEQGALFEKTRFTTMELSERLGITQQTMSNMLKRLEEEGYLIRGVSIKGIDIIFTRKGRVLLESYGQRLQSIFTEKKMLKGKVITGIGQGRFYVQQKGYLKPLKSILGYEPFHGTLNLKVDKAERRRFLLSKKPVTIEGFKSKDRSFGPLELYEVIIGKQKAGIIVPKRTHHEETIIEIIAKENLRRKLNIKDGSEVTIYG